MAFITCPECGQKISDTAKKCIYCGKVMTEDTSPRKFCSECGKEISSTAQECPYCGHPIETENSGSPEMLKTTKKSIKKSIIIISMIIITIIFCGLVVRFTYLTLNEDEQLAYQNAVTLQKMMRDPESFRLYDDMFLVKVFDGDDGSFEGTYTSFRYGGTNAYGAITTDNAIFKDKIFVVNFDDELDDTETGDSKIEKLEAKLYVSAGNLARAAGIVEGHRFKVDYSHSEIEVVQIDVKKIKAKMGLD